MRLPYIATFIAAFIAPIAECEAFEGSCAIDGPSYLKRTCNSSSGSGSGSGRSSGSGSSYGSGSRSQSGYDSSNDPKRFIPQYDRLSR